MRRILLLFVLVFSFVGANAQHYQGEINLGYGPGTGSEPVGRFYVETIHGVSLIKSHLFVGAGAGLALLDSGHAVIPVFGSVKGYFTQTKVRPYLFANLGYGFGDDEGFYGAGGLGVDFKLTSQMGLFVNLGYQSLGMAEAESNMGAVLFQVGFRF